MIFLNLLRVQIKQFLTWRLAATAVLFAAAEAFGVAGSIMAGEPSVWYVASISIGSGMGYLTLLLLPTLPFSMSLANEWNSHASIYWISRTGTAKYAIAKLFSSALSGFLVTALGMGIFLSSLRLFMPGYIDNGNVVNAYEMLFSQGSPILVWLCYVLHFGLSGALVAMFGMFVTLFIPNPFVAVSAPISVFLLLTRILSSTGIDPMSIWWPSSWVLTIHNAPTAGRLFAEKFAIVFLLCVLMCIGGAIKLKRRLEHE